MTTYFSSLSNQRDAILGDQKLGNSMMFPNQDPSERSYSDMFSGVSATPNSNYVEAMGNRNEMAFVSHGMGILDDSNFQCHGVSLSLSTQSSSMVPMPSFPFQYQTPALSSPFMNPMVCKSDESIRSNVNNGVYLSAGSMNSMLNSVYIAATQQLLNEMVSIRDALNELKSKKQKVFNGISVDCIKGNDGAVNDLAVEMSSDGVEYMVNRSSDLSPTERQELKNKNSKLLSQLGEVDRRYKQYYQQVQFLSSSFDMVAGRGAAEFYTALAHRSISCHFRRLRDAISGQIEVTRRSLGEQDNSLSNQEGIPRLRFVDQQLRHRRALQQLGVTQHSWRPQRGLPESSVSILRAWLFEHFLHPYPKDSEKLKLARQTGLTRNQVANWFINARVRLWKPMVEEMYKEEFGDSNMDFKSSPENASNSKASWNNPLLSEDQADEMQDNKKSAATIGINEQGLYHACCNDNRFNSNSFPIGKDVSLALELKHRERDGFAMFSSINSNMENGNSNTIVDSVDLETENYQCIEPETHHCRITSSTMIHDFVV